MKRVILDTNFLLVPGEYRVDIFSEIERILQEPYELCVAEQSIRELEILSQKGDSREKFSSKLALVLARQKSLKRLHGSKGLGSADDEIVELSGQDTYVATQDKALRSRVKERGAKIIGLRQKKYLVVI